MGELESFPEQTFHFVFARARVLPPNTLACDLAGQLMKPEGDKNSLLTRHLTIALNLMTGRSLGGHFSA